MTNLIKKTCVFASVLGAAAILAGCSSCPTQHHNKKAMHHNKQYVQPVEMIESDTIVVYQTYENADVNHLYAKMYTHSSHGGESRMGHIKFRDTDSGLKMEVDFEKNEVRLYYNGDRVLAEQKFAPQNNTIGRFFTSNLSTGAGEGTIVKNIRKGVQIGWRASITIGKDEKG